MTSSRSRLLPVAVLLTLVMFGPNALAGGPLAVQEDGPIRGGRDRRRDQVR